MKYIAFIVLGLVLLAAIGGIILRANMPTAKLTVRAVRPTGTNLIAHRLETYDEVRTNEEIRVWGMPVPIWEVTITNNGSALAQWYPVLAEKDGKRIVQGEAIVSDFGPSGSLPPGGWTNVNIPIPAFPTSVWTLAVRYDSPPSTMENKLRWFKSVPILRNFLPNNGWHFAYDNWHSGTNVMTARGNPEK